MMGGTFHLMSLIFPLFFLGFFCVFIVLLGKNLVQWGKNNQSPVLTVEAKVVTKRSHISHHANTDGIGDLSSSRYYVTFEVESGDRMELNLSGSEYGLLAEGDYGSLTFQGTRYQGFKRET